MIAAVAAEAVVNVQNVKNNYHVRLRASPSDPPVFIFPFVTLSSF